MFTQEIRYTTTADNVRIAWASSGSGPPLVKTANWLNHLEHDWESPVWRHIMSGLSADFRFIRYDQRGSGLSDWDVDELSFEAFVSDLEAVVDAAGLEKFSLLGISQGCGHSIAYAVRHPERVEKIVLHGGYAAGHRYWTDKHRERRAALAQLAEQGWGKDNPAFLQVFSAMFFPDGGHETHDAWNELQTIATPAETALRISAVNASSDVRDILAQVRVPVLVTHCRDEMAVPFECSRILASGLPDARLVSLGSRNHLLLEDEPAWPKWLHEVRSFLGVAATGADPVVQKHTPESFRGSLEPEAGTDETYPPGEKLLHYRVIEHIASGGMGAVYRAHDTNLRRDVAIKVLPNDFAEDEARLARFQREARMLAALNHTNIASIYGLESRGERKFIVMELAEGGTLRDRLRSGPLPIDEAVEVGRGVAAGLKAAHAKDIVHRDLKPSNVILTPDGVKLLDFGIAKPLPSVDLSREVVEAGADDLTDTGVLLGTGPYMSPEQVRGQEVGKPSDLWSFGCLLYETLRGRSPFRRDTLADTLSAVLHHEADLAALPGNTPRELTDLLRRCLVKDASERLGDVTAVKTALDDIAAGRGDGGRRGVFGWLKKGSS